MSGPLEGIRVLSFGLAGVGPWSAVLLGEMGADVIKVEPLAGDNISRSPAPYKNGITTVYIASNLNKRLVQVDLHDETVRETMFELVRNSDILVENHRPGFLDRRGLSYETVHEINPRLIYCSSSGYGSKGPYADIQMGSSDGYGQAIGGFASVSGEIGSIPEGMKGTSPLDHAASQYIVSGVLSALYHRETTGLGQFVDVSQMHASVGISAPRAAEFFASGVSPVPMGSGVGTIVPSRAFQANDKKWLNVSALDDATWQRLCAALELRSLASDTRLQHNAGRVEHRDEVDGALAAVFATQPAEHWIKLLLGAGVPAEGYWKFNQLRINEQVKEQKGIEDVDTPWGRVTVGGMPWEFSRTPGEIKPTHRPGSDTDEIMSLFAPKDVPTPIAPATGRTTTKGPLEGLKVVDITQGYSGFCGMNLGDLGAVVIKVEPPGGDYLRMQGPPFVGDTAAAFLGANRSKQGIRLAWETDAKAREAFDRLVADADVLISDLQPTAARERGVDYDSLKTKNPRLVLTSITPFGDTGPMADQPATDLEIQGISGQWQYVGEPGGAPVRMGIPIGPVYAAVFGIHGTLAALYERARSGQGQRVSISQLTSQLAMQSTIWASESEPDDWSGHVTLRDAPPARGYKTGDRSILWGFGRDDEALKTFLSKIGMTDPPTRVGGLGDRVNPKIEEVLMKYSSDEIIQWVRDLGGTAVPVHTFESLQQDPQALAVGLVSEYDYPGVGRMGTTGLAWQFSNATTAHGRPPLLGEHTNEVLTGLGLPAADVQAIEKASQA